MVVFVHDRFGTDSDTIILFRNCTISNGNRDFDYFSETAYAGGVHLYYGSSGSEFGNQLAVCTDRCSTDSPYDSPLCSGACRKASKRVVFYDCAMFNNRALWGAAMYVVSLTDALKCIDPEVTIIDCDIWGNVGVDSVLRAEEAYVGIFEAAPEGDLPVKQLSFTIMDSKLFNNVASGQAVVLPVIATDIVGATLHIRGFGVSWVFNCSIINNKATGLSVRDGSLHIRDTVRIEANEGVRGGGILLVNEAQLTFHDEVHLFIVNNTANVGGGIYIDKMYSRNPKCFFDLGPFTVESGKFLLPIEVIISDNKAAFGLSIYGGFLDSCSISLFPFQVKVLDAFYHVFNISNQSLSDITSDVRRICRCFNGQPQCMYRNTSVSTFPGRTFEVEAVPVGLFNGTVPAVVLTTVKAGYEGSLGPQQDAQQIGGIQCALLRYSLSSNDSEVYLELKPNAEGPLLGDTLEVAVNFIDCPRGFQLEASSGTCECIPFLNDIGVTCDIENVSFHRPVPIWMGYRDNAILIHDRCPFDYCKAESVSITLENTDHQCEHKRSGILCGGCQEGLSLVFQSSRCKKCSNFYISLLLVFILTGFILVLILIYMDITVASGAFNGLIFYANIIQIYKNVIFPSGHVNPLTVFIAWLNLDLGIELCFYNGMDEYARSWLQFLFPVYIWGITIFIIVASWYSTRIARISGSNAVAVLATLLLLSYTKLQRVILQIVSLTFLRSDGEDQVMVWIYDGNISYFSLKHIFLVVAALLFLIGFIAPYTLLVLFGPLLLKKFGRLMVRFRITPILDAYQGPYEVRFRWWPGVILIIRSVLILAFASNVQGNPRVNLMIIVTTVVLVLGIVWNVGTVYKQRLNNVLEAFFFVNLALLCAWTEYNRQGSSDFLTSQTVIAYTFVSMSLLVFSAVLVCHICTRFRKHLHCYEWLEQQRNRQGLKQGCAGNGNNIDESELPELRTL